jgi:DNA mismatch endonuclease, patch repair protein
VDSVSVEIRSKVMARVRSKRNRSTEWRLRLALVRAGIRGWKMNSSDLIGKPDFVFPIQRLAIFVDGCFWHGCPKCKRIPGSNVSYWNPKIERNRIRDRRVSKTLRNDAWRVARVWEHQLGQMAAVVGRIRTLLDSE